MFELPSLAIPLSRKPGNRACLWAHFLVGGHLNILRLHHYDFMDVGLKVVPLPSESESTGRSMLQKAGAARVRELLDAYENLTTDSAQPSDS